LAEHGRVNGSRRSRRRHSDFRFEEPNLAEVWAKLALTATQLSRLTGISRRQVEWWRQRGYLTPSPQEPDRFNGDAVTLALLIKQGLDAGIPLHRSYNLAREHLADILARGAAGVVEPGEHPDASALLDLEQKLIATHNTIGLVLEAVAPLAKRAERMLRSEAEPEAAAVAGGS
jgi:DNA-binding transcriptional MerR regulator